jgi:predicted PurR-regulated permease PerM
MKDLPGYAKFALLTISIAMVIAAMRYAHLLLVPMVWALLLTLMVLPIAKWLERRIKFRALTAILTISIFVIIVGGVFFLFSTQALRLRGDGPLIEKKLSSNPKFSKTGFLRLRSRFFKSWEARSKVR